MLATVATGTTIAQRRPIVGGNWKCNPASSKELQQLIANVNACDTSRCDVYVCPSPLHVALCVGKITSGAHVAAQNCNFIVRSASQIAIPLPSPS